MAHNSSDNNPYGHPPNQQQQHYYPYRNPASPQSIPLQDLSRPPGEGGGGGDGDEHAQSAPFRSGSVRSRNLLRGRGSRGGGYSGRYEPLTEHSPSPTERQRQNPSSFVTTPLGIDQPARMDGQQQRAEEPMSPVEDAAGFQAALGFAGLSFDGGHDDVSPPLTPPNGRNLDMMTGADDFEMPYRQSTDEGAPSLFAPSESDRIPLTDTQYLQPMAGATPQGQDHDRSSFQSVRISGQNSPGRMLGDDLNNAEAGLSRSQNSSLDRAGSRSGRSRSLSPSSAASPLHRASTMVRKMSQRIVNLSNEPEILEQSNRRNNAEREARMTEPPSLPAFTQHAHDAESSEEKPTFFPSLKRASLKRPQVNPLKGKTMGIFSPDNRLRMRLCDLLVHPLTEPIILVLIVIQTILLAIESAPNVYAHGRSAHWGSSWIDYALFILFAIYTLEIIVRVIVSGFIMNPIEFSTIDRKRGFRKAVMENARTLLNPQRRPSRMSKPNPEDHQQPSIIRTFTGQPQLDVAGHGIDQQRLRLARRAYLRHGFNRLDFVAVVSFWISFVLSILQLESASHIYVFKMLSCLRIVRLLGLTSGTSVILRSLKKAAPSLLNVAFLIGFFWLLFAIVGVQSFKGSLRRNCIWFDPDDPSADGLATPNDDVNQFCGGHLNSSGGSEAWIYQDGTSSGIHKGYLCPFGSKCIESDNPFNGTVHFDNVVNSLQLIFVIMSSNTFSDLLYYTTQTDYLTAALFFALGIVIMSLWLMNLLVAVITSSFQVIREESRASAFTAEEKDDPVEEEQDVSVQRENSLKRLYERTQWIWVIIIIYDLVIQCLRTAEMSPSKANLISSTETVVTLVLLAEIGVRFAIDWRNFHKSKRNWVDLAIAVITSIIQIPPIHNSGQPYQWLTFFQIIRIYRPVLAISLTRDLIMMVLGNFTGVLNLILFVFLVTFLTAIFAVQIFRGEIPEFDSSDNANQVTFANIYNSFLGMYQVLSSENWTSVVYSVSSYTNEYHTAWIGVIFFILWFILANFIVLNMFIAVIQENFDVTEDEKRLQQFKAFLQRRELAGSSHGNLSLSTIFKFGRTNPQKDPLDYGPASLEMLLQDQIVQDFLADQNEVPEQRGGADGQGPSADVRSNALRQAWKRLTGMFHDREPNPFYSRIRRANEALDPRSMAKEVVDASWDRKRAQREYLQKYPRYNKALFIFTPSNPIRNFCQHIVGPGRGDKRFEGGVEPTKLVWYSFSAFIYAAIVAMVILACITTPLYQKEYAEQHGQPVGQNWFVYTDLGFAILFTVEAAIKVIADGFFWTPNAYFRGSWGFIDGLVLITLWIDVGTSLFGKGSVYRAVGAFKALRALRLLNISDSARDTFHSVIVLGVWKVVSSAFVSLSLLIPFAIYGLNLFSGKMASCNDNSPGISNLTTDCVGEYTSNAYNFDVLAPRVMSNSYFDFDDFGDSLFILFQIVSQEGWTDVMWSAQSITGYLLQPQPFASPGNALFFVVFNLLGAVFVLTLFVSVFMRNYTEQTGVAFLTAEQRSWLELRKLLQQISPSKRPFNKKTTAWREWCYRRAVKKHGQWQRFVTLVLLLHLALLVAEFYPENAAWDRTRDYIFLLFTAFYIANIVIRIIGLTWARFRKSSWDLYSIFAVAGTFITTVLLLSNFQRTEFEQLHKYFLVSIALLLIPRNNQLDQLFKTAAASLTAIGNLLATWFVLFIVFAIALTQTFGLTKFGSNEDGNLNFRNVPKALILLFRMSCGEGWNSIMNDYATMEPPFCTASDNFALDDCGNASWAYALFIMWNILSMYIFVSLFVSLIFESFSYVYQRSTSVSDVSREEIRRFKEAWATYDPRGTGFISKEKFPRLLGELSGVFEMRIYYEDFTVNSILDGCRQDQTTMRHGSRLSRQSSRTEPGVFEGVDLDLLRMRINQIPVERIRERRRLLNLFYEDVMVSADPVRGVSFTSTLMLLVHNKVISDNKHLRLEEFLRRRQRLQRIDEQVRRNVVRDFIKTIRLSRKLRQFRESKKDARLQTIPTFAVPEIFVDDDETGQAGPSSPSPAASGSASQDMLGHSQSVKRAKLLHSINTAAASQPTPGPSSSSQQHLRGDSHSTVSGLSTIQQHLSPDSSPRASPRSSLSPSQRQMRYSDGSEQHDGSFLGYASGSSAGAGSTRVTRSRQNSVLDVIDNSVWGDSIRRSFTTHRSPRRSEQ